MRRRKTSSITRRDETGKKSILYSDHVHVGLTFQGAFVWDQSGIRMIGIMRVSVCSGAILIPEYLDFHSGYSAPRSRIAGIYSGIYSYSGISQTNAPSDFPTFLCTRTYEIPTLLYSSRARLFGSQLTLTQY